MGIYFATGSRDKTARLWSTDRTSALRIYAGHLSDVDVSSVAVFIVFHADFDLVCGVPPKLTLPCNRL